MQHDGMKEHLCKHGIGEYGICPPNLTCVMCILTFLCKGLFILIVHMHNLKANSFFGLRKRSYYLLCYSIVSYNGYLFCFMIIMVKLTKSLQGL